MKICYVVETYTDGLGYIDNLLPFELAKLGDEVHLITCRLPVYYQNGTTHFSDNRNARGTGQAEQVQGVTIHTCKAFWIGSRPLMVGLGRLLGAIKPDVVIVRGLASPVLGQVVLRRLHQGFSLFTSTGQAYSTIPANLKRGSRMSISKLKHWLTRYVPGRLFGTFTTCCIGSTADCVDCAVEFYGVNRKRTAVISLGVDTRVFYPVKDAATQLERELARADLGIEKEALLCIWTGRMTPGKGIPILAQAIEELSQEGLMIRGLFVGSGTEAKTLDTYSASIHREFLPWKDLAKLYRAADVAVWPKSITTSTLDASACGLPVVMSSDEKATERWEGIGSTYKAGSVSSLKGILRQYQDESLRHVVGKAGVAKMHEMYSWQAIAVNFREIFGRHKGA